LSKLVFLNSLVILLVILLAGLSLKNYACYLVNSEKIIGQDLVNSLNGFLWKVSAIVFLIVGLFHYLSAKKIVGPINHLSEATRAIMDGKPPSKVETKTTGELEELIRNFNAMSETLYSIQEQREEMLRDIAHELRTPLTNINGYLEALQNEVIEGNPELFGSLLEESRRITRIVELITELHSWTNGNYFLDKQFDKIPIEKVLLEALTTFHLKLEASFPNISIQIEQESLLGNKDGLMQVFTNILQNILDYNTGSTLTIRGHRENEFYIVSFTHIGQFIDPEKKELIFERFYRVEESRSTKSDGAGLGLAIAKSIINAHNGRTGVHTDGTHHTFWVEIPLLEDQIYLGR
jgi:two-component system, OmpR family, sensor histidine kinase BaeS